MHWTAELRLIRSAGCCHSGGEIESKVPSVSEANKRSQPGALHPVKKSSIHLPRVILSTLVLVLPLGAQRNETPGRSGPLEHHDGYLPFVWDGGRGKVLFEISKLNE